MTKYHRTYNTLRNVGFSREYAINAISLARGGDRGALEIIRLARRAI